MLKPRGERTNSVLENQKCLTRKIKKKKQVLKNNNSKENILGRGYIHKDCMIFSWPLEQHFQEENDRQSV